MDRGWRLVLLAGVWAALAAATDRASGADLAAPPPLPEEHESAARQWTLTFTSYSWLTGLNGNATVRGRTADVDVDAIEVLEHLDGAPWMSYGEARLGRLALYGDIVYAPLGVDVGAVRSFRGLTLDASLGLNIEQTIVEAGAAYEIAQWSSGGFGYTAVDLLAGARYWHQEASLHLALTAALDRAGLALSRGRAIARAGSVEWVDPLVGLRMRHVLAPGQELLLRGDVGGFEAGSRFSWNVVGAYSFEIGTHYGVTYSGMLGYRALGVDFEKGAGIGRYEYDVIQHGPLLGLTVRF